MQENNGALKLTRIAKKKILLSKNPYIVILFGSIRTGKSTIASHLMSGPKSNISQTLAASSAKSCTKNINALGSIKCKEFAYSFGIKDIALNNENMNRDIFIVDSEGLNSFDDETAWLKPALLAMLPINTISLYVGKIYK